MISPSHPVSHPLVQEWSEYKSKVLSARQKANLKNIHELRVSTQKFEAILKISQGLMWSGETERLMKSLCKTRKLIGPLRDLQVGIRIMGKRSKDFSRFIKFQKKKRKDTAEHHLRKISLKKERNLVKEIMSKQFIAREGKLSLEQIQVRLTHGARPTYLKFHHALNQTNPEKSKTFHRFRIAAKQLRYQEEAIQMVSGSSPTILPLLKSVQSSVGHLQDERVLLRRIKRYLSRKKYRDDEKMIEFRKQLESKLKQKILHENHQLQAIKREIEKWKN